MFLKSKLFAKTAIVLAVLAFNVSGLAQEPDPSPSADPTAQIISTPEKTKSETEPIANFQDAKPAATPEPDFRHRETVTAMGVARKLVEEKAVELEFQRTT